MSVVNVKVTYIRPFHQNLKEWCDDPNNIYIGRRGIVFINGVRYPTKDSPYANPYKITKDLTRTDVINMYRTHIVKEIALGNINIECLRNKNLGCWCKPESCHGDVLIELLENDKSIISGKDNIELSIESDPTLLAPAIQQKVRNPETNRMIMIEKGVYNNLIKKGYHLVNGKLIII